MKNFLTFLLGAALFGGLCFYVFYKNPQTRNFEKNLVLAKQGDETAAVAVADAYAVGAGVKQDGVQAVEWYRQAAAQGNTQAMLALAHIYQKGDLTEADPEEGFVYLQIAAANNSSAAQEELASFYAQGKPPAVKHEGEALLWQIRAARNGSDTALQTVQEAQEKTPDLYKQVFEFEENLQKAKHENSLAAQEAAFAWRRGEVVLQNNEEAFRLFSKAWEDDPHLSATAFELAEMLRTGEGTEKDEAKALQFYAAAAALKNPAAQYYLGTRSYENQPANFYDAFAWFSNAAEQGHPAAQYMTGFMLLQGQGTQKSLPLAVEFFRRSAEQNHAPAQYVLGQMYLKGLGVKQNKDTARRWLESAAANGNQAAQALLQGNE